MTDSHHYGHYIVPYLFNKTSATSFRRYKQHSRGGRGSAEISNFSLHHMAGLPSQPFFKTFCLAVTQHHHDEGWAAHLSQFSFSSFQFPWQLPVLVLSLLSCLRPLFLGLPGCYTFPILYYIKITPFFSHLHPVKLLHWPFVSQWVQKLLSWSKSTQETSN